MNTDLKKFMESVFRPVKKVFKEVIEKPVKSVLRAVGARRKTYREFQKEVVHSRVSFTLQDSYCRKCGQHFFHTKHKDEL